MLSKCIGTVAAMVLALALAACSTNPATGKRQFNIIGDKQEISLGVQAEPEFTKEYGGEIPSPQIQRYVEELGQRLAAQSERRNLPWNFTVLDSEVINAFALPGGKVFMSRALLARMENEAQLAGVLGHEIGHVTAQHIGQQMSQALVLQGVATGISAYGSASRNQALQALGVGTQLGGTVYLLKFGRDQESQADELGVRYMTRLGYNPVAQIQVMEILKSASGARGGPPEILATHPYPDTRIERLNDLIQKRYPNYADPGQYKFNFDEFRRNVLDPLAKLPPPKHTGREQTGGSQLRGRSR